MKIFMILFIIAIYLGGCTTIQSTYIPTTRYRHYDKAGNYSGHSIETKYSIIHYDKHSHRIGKTIK